MRIKATHFTLYGYQIPVQLNPHIFRLRPRTNSAQQLLNFEIQIVPAPVGTTECLDQDGNLALNTQQMSKASNTTKKAPAAKKAVVAKKGTAEREPTKKPAKATKEPEPTIEAPEQASETPAKAGGKGGKGALILAMIGGVAGATLSELMEATGWQKHSIRGFISTASKKRGIESVKDEAGQRRYRLVD